MINCVRKYVCLKKKKTCNIHTHLLNCATLCRLMLNFAFAVEPNVLISTSETSNTKTRFLVNHVICGKSGFHYLCPIWEQLHNVLKTKTTFAAKQAAFAEVTGINIFLLIMLQLDTLLHVWL